MFGARGEIERSDQNDSTRRIVSIRTATSMAVILNVITLCVYLVIWLFWWWLLIRAYEPRLSATAFLRWWECVVFVATEWGAVMGRTWPLWVILLPLEWPTPLLILYTRNLYPKLLNDNWPPPSAQIPPMEAGALTWHNWDERASVGTTVIEQVVPEREEIAVTITDQTTQPRPEIKMCVLFSPADHPGMLARFAGALVRKDAATRAAFSFEGGKNHAGARYYRYTRKEYEELEVECRRAGLIEREKKNQPSKITVRGAFTFYRLGKMGTGHTELAPSPTLGASVSG